MELLAHNKALFERQGVKPPPKTWDDSAWTLGEFLQRAQALTKAPAGAPEQFGLGRPGAQWVAWPLLWGADWVSADQARFQGAAQAVVDSLQLRQDAVWKQHVAPQPGETALFGSLSSSQRFLSGRVAMADLGTWYLQAWSKQATFAWDVAPWFRAGGAGAPGPAAGPIYPWGRPSARRRSTRSRPGSW
jgi:ABC-type glycerol-3-phosphate transport system substrate-binding protein